MKRLLTGSTLALILLLAACGGADDPQAQAVIDYLEAKVDGDADSLAGLLCAALESQLRLEAESFASVEASLRDAACETAESDADTVRVTCEGYIFVDYGREQSELPLGAYRVVKEGGEWKWCGETD